MYQYGEPDLPQLLFIHGGGVGAWMWDEVVHQLNPYYHCLIVSLPYHNSSYIPDGPFTIESYAKVLLADLQPLRNEKPIGVIGFSLGAQIAIELISLAPHIFQFAMINSGLCTPSGIPLTFLKPLVALSMPLAHSRTFAKLQAKMLYISDSLFEHYFILSKTITAPQLLEILSTNMQYRLKPELSQTTTKIHITYGSLENKAIKNSARELNQLLPHSTTYVVPKLGHGFPLAEPTSFSNYVKSNFPFPHHPA